MADNVTKAAKTEFEGADLEALRDYCDRLGLEFSKNHNAATLRKMLNKAMSNVSKHYAETVVGEEEVELTPEEAQDAAMKLVGLNLKAQAGWEGRRRVIQLHRSMSHESTRPQFFAWGRLHCYVPMGIECAIPYPIFEILKVTAGKRLVQRRKVDEEGRIRYDEEWVNTQRFMFSDLGDDPETANLPRHMLEMIQGLHGLTDGFAGYSKRQFQEICRRLFIAVEEDWDETDMKAAVEAKCGFTAGRVDLGVPDLSQAAAG